MKTQIKEITPKWASQILQTRNPLNRNISRPLVEKLVRDIKAGAWVVTHQGIALDDKGDLIDGQHRLEAVRQANVSVKMQVTFGLPAKFQLNGTTANTFEVIDCGRPRSVPQMLSLRGWKNSTRVAAVARALVNWSVGYEDWVAMSTVQTEKVLFQVGNSIDYMVKGSISAINRPTATVLAPLVLYHSAHKNKAVEFAEKFFTLDNVPRKHPASALASWVGSHAEMKASRKTSACRVASSAIWHYEQGNQVDKIYENTQASEWLLSQNKSLVNFIRELFGTK